jgi:hypothetical protein
MTSLAASLLALALLVSGATAKPRVWVTSKQPVVVRGTGFHSLERVELSLSAKGLSRHRALKVSRTGAFTARFTATSLPAKGCLGLVVRAVGAAGSRATFRLPDNAVDCAPPQPTDP